MLGLWLGAGFLDGFHFVLLGIVAGWVIGLMACWTGPAWCVAW